MDSRVQKLIEMGILPDPNYVPREKTANRFGVVVWDHKTGGTCQVLNKESFNRRQR